MGMILAENLTPISMEDVKAMAQAAQGYIEHLYWHWTAGWYGQAYDDYHFCIDQDGQIYAMCDDLTERKNHTWHRNTGAVGIAILGCADAHPNSGYDTDFGSAPPTKAQIESLAKLTQVLADGLGLPYDAEHMMTHCEAAELDDYGPSTTCERWDLWYLVDDAKDGELVPGGQLIRDKAAWYSRNNAA